MQRVGGLAATEKCAIRLRARVECERRKQYTQLAPVAEWRLQCAQGLCPRLKRTIWDGSSSRNRRGRRGCGSAKWHLIAEPKRPVSALLSRTSHRQLRHPCPCTIEIVLAGVSASSARVCQVGDQTTCQPRSSPRLRRASRRMKALNHRDQDQASWNVFRRVAALSERAGAEGTKGVEISNDFFWAQSPPPFQTARLSPESNRKVDLATFSQNNYLDPPRID